MIIRKDVSHLHNFKITKPIIILKKQL